MNKEFATHRLNQQGIDALTAMRGTFDTLLNSIVDILPAGRELAIVRTKLEEACFFAIKGISVAEVFQGSETPYVKGE